jgi:hypothetical protein
MRTESGLMVPLGYGEYCRAADSIASFEPPEEGRGPGQCTKVCIEQRRTPIIVPVRQRRSYVLSSTFRRMATKPRSSTSRQVRVCTL